MLTKTFLICIMDWVQVTYGVTLNNITPSNMFLI